MSPTFARQVVGSFHSSPPAKPDEALTPREQQLLDLLVEGEPTATAESLGLSIDTVRTHVRKVYGKLRV